MTLSPEEIRELPKVVLHDHLDGGLRPGTVWELAAERGHKLPVSDPAQLADWFFAAADSGSLVRYLETFEHTVAVMQTAAQLRRVAREWVLDLAADGVIYGEARWAPEQHLRAGLTLDAAIAAVGEGLREGMDEAASQGLEMAARQLVTSLRHTPPSAELGELAIGGAKHLVCGFDLAGPEDGYPAELHERPFKYLRAAWVPITIHAGEAAGLDSIVGALSQGALRLGHGARLVEDLEATADGWHLGPVATWVRDRRIALEMCPSSNLQTGVAGSIGEHPFGLLAELDFPVTVNCDNRLMSRTSMSRELTLLTEAFGYGHAEVTRFMLNAAHSAFVHYHQRQELIEQIRG
ncbi:MAG: adenosine deaminase [Propioniciclava sp.]